MLGVRVAVENSTAQGATVAYMAFAVVCVRAGAIRDICRGIAKCQVVNHFQRGHIEAMVKLDEPAAFPAVPTGGVVACNACVDSFIEQLHLLDDVRPFRLAEKQGWLNGTWHRRVVQFDSFQGTIMADWSDS